MVTCQPLLLAALTVTTGLLGMGSRGLQVIDPDDPPSEAVDLESLSQQVLQDESKRGTRIDSDASGDSCGDATPTDAQSDHENGKMTPFNTTKEEPVDGRAGRFQRTTSRWEAVLPGVARRGRQRRKRAALYWPADSLFVAEFFFIVPIQAPTGVSIPFTIDVPYEFTLPNVTKIGAMARDDRLDLYGVVERLFERFGLDGRECLLRAVCERASSSLEGAGMLGEVLTTILTASLSTSSEGMYEYVLAEHNGRTDGECWTHYPRCPISLFNWLE
ncbi:uncharacterized protein LOC126996582 [Eriocheir sinensis]|uniref:uncharacterized protein LOC126996582 n=1 Tax=Eriocheir sinensis TaxID=95602 RepID=UPI0021CA2E49|nr:uncharacterized protein LOC126996582 [Eriocheir sinensis]